MSKEKLADDRTFYQEDHSAPNNHPNQKQIQDADNISRVEYSETSQSFIDYNYIDLNNIEKDLMCTICQYPFIDPIVHSECGQMFCSTCIRVVDKCPLCRANNLKQNSSPVPKYILNKLDELKVQCSMCKSGVQRGLLKDHQEKYCPLLDAYKQVDQTKVKLMQEIEEMKRELKNEHDELIKKSKEEYQVKFEHLNEEFKEKDNKLKEEIAEFKNQQLARKILEESTKPIHLNVCGTIMTVSLGDFINNGREPDNLFKKMFTGQHPLYETSSSTFGGQVVFINCDPIVFKHILDWLRYGIINLKEMSPGLVDACQYFELTNLEKQLLRSQYELHRLSNLTYPGGDLNLHLEGVNLRNFILQKTKLENSSLIKCNFSGMNLKDTNFKGSNLRGCNFSNCDLTSTNFHNCDLSECNFTNSILRRTDFSNALLVGTLLESAKFEETKFISTKFEKVIGLQNYNLSKIDFSKSSFVDCNLSGCDLSGANLNGTLINSTTFENVNFTDTIISKTSFENSSFTKCKIQVHITKNNPIINCKFIESEFNSTIFEEVDISIILKLTIDSLNNSFTNCIINNSDLRSLKDFSKLRGLKFDSCLFNFKSLQNKKVENIEFENIDFQSQDLSGIVFSKCKLINIKSMVYFSLISTIINECDCSMSTELFNHTNSKSVPQLIYRGTRDGFNAKHFHNKCDNQGPTLTIVKSEHDQIFGAFTSQAWKSSHTLLGDYISDDSAFIFKIVKDYNGNYQFQKFKIKKDQKQYAICLCKNYLPTFGDVDIFISTDCDSNSYSRSSFGNTFELPKGIAEGSEQAKSYLAGSSKFRVLEIEVFKINLNN